MINKTINQIVVTTQATLISTIPMWETKEQYQAYTEQEQEITVIIRELTAQLEELAKSGANKETIKRVAIQIIGEW